MKKSSLIHLVLLFVLNLSLCSYGYLEFYGYQEYIKNDSLRYRQIKLGSVQLEISEIHITPKGAYLDIVEDAWVSPNISTSQIPDLTGDYLLKGTVSVPAKAAVAGLHTWKSNTLFRARLRPSIIDFDVTFLDSATLKTSLNSRVAQLQKLNETEYSITFTKVDLGERKHVRIRYLLPNTGNGKAQYAIPVLFHSPYSSTPRFVKFTVLADSLKHPYTVNTQSGIIQLTDSSSNMIPYQKLIPLSYAPETYSTIHKTQFLSGEYAGTYLLLNTSIPDSVFMNLSNPMETVFIWRWNKPYNFITIENQKKALSSHCYTVLEQVRTIKETIEILAKRGHRCGFIHSIEQKQPIVFPICSTNDSNYVRMMEYLGTYNEQYMYDTYKDQTNQIPDWIVIESPNSTTIENARAEFLSILQSSKGMYSVLPNILKHMVINTFITVPKSINVVTPEYIDSSMSGITIDATNTSWRGVDPSYIIPGVADQNLYKWNNFYFPAFQPAALNLKINNSFQPYSFPLAIDAESFSISIKASYPWDSTLLWEGYDHLGNSIGNTMSNPLIFDMPSDSGLVKVWARDEDHTCESEETNLGARYGIVTKAMYLRATINDTSNEFTNGISFLKEDEIVPVKVIPQNKPGFILSYKYMNGNLSLLFAQKYNPTKLSVFDVKGRKLLTVQLARYKTGSNKFLIPIKNLINRLGTNFLIVNIRGTNINKTFTLICGGTF